MLKLLPSVYRQAELQLVTKLLAGLKRSSLSKVCFPQISRSKIKRECGEQCQPHNPNSMVELLQLVGG